MSNIEVIHKEIEGAMYTFKYKVVETGQILNVSTTRPETMFGDVCVCVHPDDPRYTDVIGKHVINPANGDELPIIADSYIDIEFGTGAMKCTPAHDPNDFLIGEKYKLPKIICMNPDGTMNECCGEFKDMDRFECRKALVKKIEAEGNLVSIEKHMHQVGHSERTDVIVEPYLSKQWFVKMKPAGRRGFEASGKSRGENQFRTRCVLKRLLINGLKISRIGVFPVSFGGDTVSQPGIIKTAVRFMSAMKIQRILKTGFRMRMY